MVLNVLPELSSFDMVHAARFRRCDNALRHFGGGAPM
jgi:hypothetical protein